MLVECVPNVSEGRDGRVLDELAAAVASCGVDLVDVHRDVDHHRSVFTFLGPPAAVEAAALALARKAMARVDLRSHFGVHPRVGAVDVIPFVPLRGASMSDAADAARRTGRALAADLGVPVYLYGAACTGPRRELPEIRRGGLTALAERMRRPEHRPDFGEPPPHPSAGVCAVGARNPLIAFNALLDTGDTAVARDLARRIRQGGGGLPSVQAIGVFLSSQRRAQVAMNLLDYRRTSPEAVARALFRLCRERGAAVLALELVGCAPADAFWSWPADLPPLEPIASRRLLDPGLFADARA